MSQGPLAVAGLRERAAIHLGDPILVRTGAVLGDDEPEQPERGLARNVLALEQHAAEQGLRPVIALVGRESQPTRGLDGVLRRALAIEVEPSEIVLGLGIGEIRGCVAKHFARHVGIGLQGPGNAVEVYSPKVTNALAKNRAFGEPALSSACMLVRRRKYS